MARFLINLIVLSVLIMQVGCVVQSRQVNTLISLIKEPTLDISFNRWSLNYLDYKTVVYAITTPGGVIFSNRVGDQLFFDGWVIREIKSIGGRKLNIKVEDIEKRRFFKVSDRITSDHHCEEWIRQERGKLIRYTQNCGVKQKYTNSIMVWKNGNVSSIRQIVDEKYTALILTKLK